ncbi:hypothetical protein FACS189430_05940 [Bacteroidia bacterium]|nr:hypothetical protein FACS189430_05940 [Bacteroidia bacterium]
MFSQVKVIRDAKTQTVTVQVEPLKPLIEKFEAFVWPNERPSDCPFPASNDFRQIQFLGIKSGFHYGDTWYPTWGDDDLLYSPYTDGKTWRLDGSWDGSMSWPGEKAVTGHGVIEGNDPLSLVVYSLGTQPGSALPYDGRYPCGSLMYNGVWYYGTYCLGPSPFAKYGDITYNWPWLGPFVGFRTSTNKGLSWRNCPHTPEKPIFGENGLNGYPVKIGAPHFVDFGKNMEYSPDGKAYMVAHGADVSDPKPRFWNASWITGDNVYLLRVTPSPENMNDPSQWEFYSGKDANGRAIWSNDFSQIKPLLEWNNNMGCVTVTYNAPLKKYLMCVTDGGNTSARMNTYVLESESLTGEWKLISYMKSFGEQAYFVNIPSKFISKDGKTMWMMYSGNFAPHWNGQNIKIHPVGSHYGLVMQKIQLSVSDDYKAPMIGREVNSIEFTNNGRTVSLNLNRVHDTAMKYTTLKYKDASNKEQSIRIENDAATVTVPGLQTGTAYTLTSTFQPAGSGKKLVDAPPYASKIPDKIKMNFAEWKALSCSSETANTGGGFTTVIDDKTNTYWHSAWGVDPLPQFPHWILIDMATPINCDITSIEMFRSPTLGIDTDTKTVQYFVSNHPEIDPAKNTTWKKIAEGSFKKGAIYENVRTTVNIPEGINIADYGRYLKIVFPDNWGRETYSQLAEFYFYGTSKN